MTRIRTIKEKKVRELKDKKPKEIKQASGKVEEAEEEAENEEFFSSNGRDSGRRVAPTLGSDDNRQASIEDTVKDIKELQTKGVNEEASEMYNAENYSIARYEAKYGQTERREVRNADKEMNVTAMAFQPRAQDDLRRVNVSQWRQGMVEDRDSSGDYRVKMKKSKQSQGLPFE